MFIIFIDLGIHFQRKTSIGQKLGKLSQNIKKRAYSFEMYFRMLSILQAMEIAVYLLMKKYLEMSSKDCKLPRGLKSLRRFSPQQRTGGSSSQVLEDNKCLSGCECSTVTSCMINGAFRPLKSKKTHEVFHFFCWSFCGKTKITFCVTEGVFQPLKLKNKHLKTKFSTFIVGVFVRKQRCNFLCDIGSIPAA